MISPLEDKVNNSLDERKRRILYDYFSFDEESIKILTNRERSSLNSISEEILDWEPTGDRKNIFLIDSYKESKRNTAAAFLALKLVSNEAEIVLVRNSRELGKNMINSLTGEKAERPYVFINYIEGSPITAKEIQKIILNLGKRNLRGTPIILSLPNIYSEFFRAEKEDENVSYPQNSVSRAFVMLGMASLITPFFNFPFMQIPLGSDTAVNDSGLAVLALFTYGVVLLFYKRRDITRSQSFSTVTAIAIFILAWVVANFILAPTTTALPISSLISEPHLTGGSLDYSGTFFLSVPILMRLASFSIFPLGIAAVPGKRMLYTAFLISAPIAYFSTLLFSHNYLLIPSTPYVAQFSIQYPPIDVFSTGTGNIFMEGISGIPSAVIYFISYLLISRNLKTRYFTSIKTKGRTSSA